MSSFGSTLTSTKLKNNQLTMNNNINGSIPSNGNKSKNLLNRSKTKKSQSPMIQDEIEIETDPLDKPTRIIPSQAPIKLQSVTVEEVQLTGEMFTNPESLGFIKKQSSSSQLRPIPKYFFTQPKLLQTPPFVKNEWDLLNQAKMNEMEELNQGKDFQGLYEQLQKLREVERKKMEEMGLVDAENISKDLNDAISFQGSCLDMCPTFERIRRQLENNVKNLEKDPITNKISRSRAIKAFSRPAAGQPPPLPSEVRPPHILVETLNYLVDEIMIHLPDSHSFLWDRTRSIRQDFTYQNNFGPEAVDCNERIVRIHLLCLHLMSGSDVEYSQQQELEQFNKSLQTLMEIYTDVRNNGGECPNEAEFRAYHLLSHLKDPELERQIQNLPDHIYNNSNIQVALRFRNLINQNNTVERGVKNLIGCLDYYVEFFELLYGDDTPLLMACLLETQFSEIRFYALKAMSRAYHTKSKPLGVKTLADILGFDSKEKLIKFLKYYDIDIVNDSNGDEVVDLFNKEKLESQYKLNSFLQKAKYPPVHSTQLDKKLQNKDYKSYINSGKPNHNLKLDSKKLIKPSIKLEPIIKSNLFKTEANKLPEIKFGNEPKSTQPITTQSFQFKPPQTLQQQPTFQFNKPAESKPTPPPPTQPFTFIKSAVTKPTTTSIFKSTSSTPQPPPEPKKVSFNLTPKVDQIPTLSRSPSTTITISSSLESQQPRSITESPQFKNALDQVTSQFISNSLNREVGHYLIKIMQDFNRKNERNQLLYTLSKELYSAFLSEIIYEVTLENQAAYIYETNLKKKSIRKIAANAKNAVVKYKYKKMKIEELQTVSFKAPKKKRRFSTDSNSSIIKKQRSQTPVDVNEINHKRNEINELWAPINLISFVNQCSTGLGLGIHEPSLNLTFVLIVHDWSIIYSKWLISKFELKPDFKLKIYNNEIENDKLQLRITSLPENSHLNKEFFSNTSFILFETGILNKSSTENIEEKLIKDARVLSKIVNLLNKYSYYKFHILVLFWDVTESGIFSDRVAQLLNLQQFVSFKNLGNLILCDMTIKGADINDILFNALDKISSDFNGELTSRGIRKKSKQKTKEESVVSTTSSNISQIENKMMDHAKSLKKYNYLNQHINDSRSYAIPNQSANSTMVNNKSMLQQYIRNRTMNNSTILNSSIISNNSILKGFGKGIIKESTPNVSTTKNLDSLYINQLKELTENIKKKYRSN
ncbi:unnamed protein product [Candida verbasci]|uniref:Nuclear mRNA export factor n=1 Tax=Candida verbasci TaxID=1227364 RepID=A0A9W4TVV7_9ASCO|nr:unnamed protein product [Candida verbasci]